MGVGTITDKGYPRSSLENAEVVRLYTYCGGGGGGDCEVTLGTTSASWFYRVPKFLTYNKSLVLRNASFQGIRIYTDAGPFGICSHSLGSEVTWYLAFSVDGSLTDAQILSRGLPFSGALPYDIDIAARYLPQPTDSAWVNRIYAHVYWGNTGYINDGTLAGTIPELQIVQHNYDIKI